MTREAEAFEVIRGRWARRALYRRPNSEFWYGHVHDRRSGKSFRFSTFQPVKAGPAGERTKRAARQAVLEWIGEQEAREAQEVLTRLLTRPECAKFLRVSLSGLDMLIRLDSDPLPHSRAGRRLLFDRDETLRWARRQAEDSIQRERKSSGS